MLSILPLPTSSPLPSPLPFSPHFTPTTTKSIAGVCRSSELCAPPSHICASGGLAAIRNIYFRGYAALGRCGFDGTTGFSGPPNVVRQLVKSIKNGNRSAMLYADDFDEPGVTAKSEIVSRGLSVSKSMCAMLTSCPTLIFNEAKCSLEERTRLYVRRLGYPASGLLERMCSMKESGDLPKLTTLNEDPLVVDS